MTTCVAVSHSCVPWRVLMVTLSGLSFAKTAADSPGDAPWATGGLSTPDDR